MLNDFYGKDARNIVAIVPVFLKSQKQQNRINRTFCVIPVTRFFLESIFTIILSEIYAKLACQTLCLVNSIAAARFKPALWRFEN